ncbi:CCA-adding enzyme-CCA tRNA nucleotidyltransferase-tRNA CCA-pyrophosphorylase-tRNA adenylyl-/cytidylyl-transferase-tRNA nucleotidyltransferase-tRNA-NT [Moritella viscosa]|uniref:CCA-adding enzyme-CCA tRNA nucleotidyltransferase-tRNA CCA-pyrophosphorylase-tRNA adenylyl-/cytidylyl-transferase-tRNA nucleotidyltransferase-tRNA-NT n=1 Tax=Moritella viscosa TaxID=80854 RepID=A0ABY1HMN0_9GAMM|nr:CCA-adding enzyme-CCA tRNA nucleotidyltransferase-tRNA CCA-pyrophosphorylase-tRNA adenylyl-/cytidylyl-transferase-tRNA nucleotidyltransferase-tRNA-NT [Moritella viscosa]
MAASASSRFMLQLIRLPKESKKLPNIAFLYKENSGKLLTYCLPAPYHLGKASDKENNRANSKITTGIPKLTNASCTTLPLEFSTLIADDNSDET